jgi:hypothetical protein
MKKPRSKEDVYIRSKRIRAANKQNWRCHWCGGLMCTVVNCPHQATLDHMRPIHNGGTVRHGYVAACRKCNCERHEEFQMRKKQKSNLYATSGEVYTPSPFEALKGLVK